MGSFSMFHWLIVAAVVLLLFGGRGKISGIMGDFAKGIKAFKSGMKDEPEDSTATLDAKPQVTAPAGARSATVEAIRPADRA